MVKKFLPTFGFVFILSSCSTFKPLNLISNKPVASIAVPQTKFIDNITLTPSVAAPDFKDAFKAFKSLSRAERRERIRAAKDEIKAFKEQQKAGAASTNTLLLVILAILLPPLAVYLHEGVINSKFWISLLLTLLFFIPGIIYALIVILGHGG